MFFKRYNKEEGLIQKAENWQIKKFKYKNTWKNNC